MTSPARVAAVVSAGGVIGALARYGIGLAWPHRADQFDWATFAINVSGCFVIGVLMTATSGHPLLRPFLGTGVLGGFTTFSTYVLEIITLGPTWIAVTYALSTVVAALAAVWLATGMTRRVWS